MVFEYTQLQYGKQPPSKNENVISESCVFMAAFLLFRFLEEIIFFFCAQRCAPSLILLSFVRCRR